MYALTLGASAHRAVLENKFHVLLALMKNWLSFTSHTLHTDELSVKARRLLFTLINFNLLLSPEIKFNAIYESTL